MVQHAVAPALKVADVAERLGVSKHTVHGLIDRGDLVALLVPGRGKRLSKRILQSDFEAFVVRTRAASVPPELQPRYEAIPPRDYIGEGTEKRKRGRPRKRPTGEDIVASQAGGAP